MSNLKFIMITHHHFDHVGALEELKEKYNVPVYDISNLEEKEYNIDTFLNQIENDFKQENNLKNLKKNHYIEFIFNNSPLQMDFKALSSLVVEGQKELILFQEKAKNNIYSQYFLSYIFMIKSPLIL